MNEWQGILQCALIILRLAFFWHTRIYFTDVLQFVFGLSSKIMCGSERYLGSNAWSGVGYGNLSLIFGLEWGQSQRNDQCYEEWAPDIKSSIPTSGMLWQILTIEYAKT